MRIDLNCPAEMVGSELLREGDSVRLILMDLADRGIDSAEATVHLLDKEGKEVARTVHRARALKGRPHTTFPMNVPVEIPKEAARAEAVLDKVWFEDHDVWRRNPMKEVEYEPNALPPGNELNALKYVAGSGAVGFPSQQAGLWVCVCGRPNGNEENLCARCRRQREMIFQQYNPNAVLRQVNQRERQLDLETRGAREETARLQRLREEEYTQKQLRHRRQRRLGIALGIALVLAAAVYFGGVPALRLWSADTALRENQLEDAREILTQLGNFPGAADRLARAELEILRRDGNIAAEDENAFTQEKLSEIAARLRESAEDDEDKLLADRVELSQARALLVAGDYATAEAMLNALPEGTAGRAELLLDCAWAQAVALMDENAYEEAREIFLSLGDYPGAAEKAREALYESALTRMESGEYEEAIAAFEQILDYQDSQELIRRSWYLKGYVLESQGETEAAWQAYLNAGDYEDAPERARAIRWNQAETFLAAENYEAALPLYRELDGFEDARAKWIQCAMELARKSYRQKEYIVAVNWLEDLMAGIPEDAQELTRDISREISQIRTRGYYLGARAAANRGEVEEAVALMEHVPTYSDASKYIRTWRMDLARAKMEAGDYEAAKELLEPVAENYNAGRLLQEVEKKIAEAAAAAEEAETVENTEAVTETENAE